MLAGTVLTMSGLTSGDSMVQPPAPVAIEGEVLFVAKGCASCHTIAGVSDGGIGPDLTNLSAAPEEIRRSIVDPGAELAPGYNWAMPQLGLSETEVAALVEYLTASR